MDYDFSDLSPAQEWLIVTQGWTYYAALELGRRAIGIELKKSYFDQAVRNLAALRTHQDEGLFSEIECEGAVA